MNLPRREGSLPGFRVSLAITLGYLGVMVVLPLVALLWRSATLTPAQLALAVTGPRARAAFAVTFGASAVAATLNMLFAVLVGWVLARYRFFGRAVLDALIDLPLAIPTAVAGIALTAAWSDDGALGRFFARHGVHVAYSELGVIVALLFVGLPFAVRTLEPAIAALDPRVEEAAAVLGAHRLRTFVSVLLPRLGPAMLTAWSLAFARAIGEYGSVIFISGNIPGRTEIVPLVIVTRLEQFDYAGATATALVLLCGSFAILLALNGATAALLRRNGA